MYSRAFQSFDSIRQSDKFAACTLIFEINSNGGGSAASLYAVVHYVPYQYQVYNFQQVKNV